MPDPFSVERASLLSDVASAQSQARKSLDKARALQEQITIERGVWARERSQLLRKIAEVNEEKNNSNLTNRRNSITQIETTTTTSATTVNNMATPATPRMLMSSPSTSSSLELEAAVLRYKAAESECHRLRGRIEVLEKRIRDKISTVAPEKVPEKSSSLISTSSAVIPSTPGNKKGTSTGYSTTTSSSMKRSAIYSTPKGSTTTTTTTTSLSSLDSTATSELLSRVIDAERAKQEAISLLTDVTNEAKKQAQEVKRLTEKLEKLETNTASVSTLLTDSFAVNDDASAKTPKRNQPPPPPSSQSTSKVSTIAAPYTPRQVAAHIPQSFSSRINAATPRSEAATTTTRKSMSSLPIFGLSTPNSTKTTASITASKSPAAAKIPPSCARAKALEYASSRVPNPILASSVKATTTTSVGVFTSAIAAMRTSSTNAAAIMKDRSRVHLEMTKLENAERNLTDNRHRSNVQRTMASMPPPLPKQELQRLEKEAANNNSTIRVTSFVMKPRANTQPVVSDEAAATNAYVPKESGGANEGFAVPAWLNRLPPTNGVSAGATISAITRSDSTERHFEAF